MSSGREGPIQPMTPRPGLVWALWLCLAGLALALSGWLALSTQAAPLFQSSPVSPVAGPTSPPATVTPTPTEGPTPTPGPSPTPTPTKPPIRTEIDWPRPGDILIGVAIIEGTALVDNYQHYQLHIAPAGSETWQWLVTSFQVVRDGVLYELDTRQFPDGVYDLRLRAVDVTGNYREFFVRGVVIDNTNPPTPTPNVDATATPTPTFTPTATPDITSFVPGGQGIYAPVHGQRLQGPVRIVGTANARDIYHRFLRYELYIAPAGSQNWQWLTGSYQQLFNDTLYVLDTTRFPNGRYDLRLRIVYRDSNYHEFFVYNLEIANPLVPAAEAPVVRITSPGGDAVVAEQMAVRGTVYAPDLDRWELYWAPHPGEEGRWALLYTGRYNVVDDTLAVIDLRPVPVGLYDLRVRLVREDGNFQDTTVRRIHVVLPTPTPPPHLRRP